MASDDTLAHPSSTADLLFQVGSNLPCPLMFLLLRLSSCLPMLSTGQVCLSVLFCPVLNRLFLSSFHHLSHHFQSSSEILERAQRPFFISFFPLSPLPLPFFFPAASSRYPVFPSLALVFLCVFASVPVVVPASSPSSSVHLHLRPHAEPRRPRQRRQSRRTGSKLPLPLSLLPHHE